MGDIKVNSTIEDVLALIPKGGCLWGAFPTGTLRRWRKERNALRAKRDAIQAQAERYAHDLRELRAEHDCALETIRRYAEDLATLRAERDAAHLALANVLNAVDDGECRLDHHGYCQSHWLEDPCSVAVARDLLASAANRNKANTPEGKV